MFGLRRLKRENALLREALGWYATSSNWRKRGTNRKGEPRTWQKSPAAFDRGDRAKLALTQVEGIQGAAPAGPTPIRSEAGEA